MELWTSLSESEPWDYWAWTKHVWNLAKRANHERAEAIIEYLDPVIVHGAPPCDNHSKIALYPNQPNYDRAAMERAVSMIVFVARVISARLRCVAGGSMESPEGSRAWPLTPVVELFCTLAEVDTL